MFFNTEGLSLQGITGGFGGDRRVDFILDPELRGTTYKVRIGACGVIVKCSYPLLCSTTSRCVCGAAAGVMARRADLARRSRATACSETELAR